MFMTSPTTARTPYIVKYALNDASPLLNISWFFDSIPFLIRTDPLKRKYINTHTSPAPMTTMLINIPKLSISEKPGITCDNALAKYDRITIKKITITPIQTRPVIERNLAHRVTSERFFEAV